MYLRQGAAAIFVMGMSLCGGVEAQRLQNVCRPRMHPGEAVCSKGQMREGKLHLTVYLYPKVTEPHRAAFRDAMKVWNSQSAITQIVLDETSARTADLRFQPGDEEYRSRYPRACAAYDPPGSFIWYSEQTMRRAVETRELAVRIYAHEIGHALNLEHLPEPARGKQRTKQLMQQAERDDVACERLAVEVIADVTPEDAESARHCVYGARKDSQCMGESGGKSGGR